MRWFHGTTEENVRSIRAVGLRKSTFVSLELDAARSFASLRSRWNGRRPVVLTGDCETSKPKLDRGGQSEAVLLEACRAVEIVFCDFASDTADDLPAYMLKAATRLFTAHKARTFNRDLRYPVQRDAQNKRLCRWCQTRVPRGRMSYCSNACQIEVDVRCSANAARNHVEHRDHGICADCDCDTEYLRRVLGYAALSISNSEDYGRRKLHVRFRFRYEYTRAVGSFARLLGFGDVTMHFWEADHIVELSDGGDGGLANLQTLCIPCHKRKTASNAGRRARERRDIRRPLLSVIENAA